MGFVASPPPPAAGSRDEVEADGWWPSIGLAATRDAMRIGGQVTDARLRDAILDGMSAALFDLADWQDARQAEGHEGLDAVPGRTLGGEMQAVQLWRLAVTSYAAAHLAENYRVVAATVDGRQRAEEEAATADDHRRNALHAVRGILGVGRSRVTLL